MSRKPDLSDDDVDNLRGVQTDAFQALLFTMDQLGERSVLLQLEIDGVLHCVAAREFTQTEFDDLLREGISKR